MKITKRQLKILIESFLKEENENNLDSALQKAAIASPALAGLIRAKKLIGWTIETGAAAIDALGSVARDVQLEFKKGGAGEMIKVGDRDYLIGLKLPIGNLYQVGVIVPENAVESIKSWAKENQITLYKVSKEDIKNYWEKGYAKGIEELKGYENLKSLQDKSDRIFVMLPGVGGSKTISRGGAAIKTVEEFFASTGFETVGAVGEALAALAAGTGAEGLVPVFKGISDISNIADVVFKVEIEDYLGAGISMLCLIPAGDTIQVFKKLHDALGSSRALAGPARELGQFLIKITDNDILSTAQSVVEDKSKGKNIDWSSTFPRIKNALKTFGETLLSEYE